MKPITREECLAELFKYYAQECSITRPELGVLLGKTIGEMAAFHRDHDAKYKIGPWPRISPKRKESRKCQYPEGLPGFDDFQLCGRTRIGDPLVCDMHKDQVWTIPECEEIID